MSDTRCPNCNHVFAMEEITDEWCAECGKRIPEVLLKDVRPKPHIRHPHPLPPPTKTTQVEQARETKFRVLGLVLVVVGIVLGLSALIWGVYSQLSWGEINFAAWVGGGGAGVLFLVGWAIISRERVQEE